MEPTQLSPHFSLAELTASVTADEHGINNAPPDEYVPRLVAVAQMLEGIRTALGGVPVHISSGFRCVSLNRLVGGVADSDHVYARAADFKAPDFGTPTAIGEKLAPLVSVLGIGQLILEGLHGAQWIHVSTRIPDNTANRVITITPQGVRPGIHPLV